ncbi:DUF2835 family protein [Aestuariibacter sp. GS-14]|uniref:DUF2835 family protein n=1 Tax=Alteromonadaceae TaxID=72275 RepID=UPI00112E33B9|nr:DUF2835 family protein [Aestuariibacter sp. GS-14]TPV60074.1 DUF2835 family protein [Aestuariibacter sp. GS-14]
MTNTDKVYFFTLNESYSNCQALYSGLVPHALLQAENGIRVQVPAGRLRRFIDSRGLCGRFRLIITPENKIKSFERIR